MSAAKKRKIDETVQGVYDDGSTVGYCENSQLTENEQKSITVYGNCWILKYTVCREAGATEVRVMASFMSRYSFPDKFTLAINVEAADREITEKFDLVKESDNNFQVDLTKNGFPEVENKDIRVYCTVLMTNLKYCTEFIGTNSTFTESRRPHDVVLIVDKRKFYVHKVYLATWSKFFNALFYRNNEDRMELEINDVDSNEFNTLLELIHPDLDTRIEDSNVLYLLKLADRFIMPSLMTMCGTYLMYFTNCSEEFTDMDRLELSDKYNLAHLQVACLKRIHKWSAAEFKTFLDVNRNRIKQLSNYTMQNLI